MNEYLSKDNHQEFNIINIDIYKSHIYEQIKTHDIAGRMFEDEYDLALAIMDGMEARSVKGGYILERFKFNST